MRYSEGICSSNFNDQTRSQSHTERFKKTTICFNRKKATWSLRKKKENEKEIQANLTESLHLTVETPNLRKYHTNRKCRNHKAALNEKPTVACDPLIIKSNHRDPAKISHNYT